MTQWRQVRCLPLESCGFENSAPCVCRQVKPQEPQSASTCKNYVRWQYERRPLENRIAQRWEGIMHWRASEALQHCMAYGNPHRVTPGG